MTRQFISIVLLTAFLVMPFTSSTTGNTISTTVVFKHQANVFVANTLNPEVPVDLVPHHGTDGLKPLKHKMYVPKMEELAKIHLFHKGRLERIKKHHKKCWLSAKVLLVLCHLALLIVAYLHLTH